MDKNYLRLKYLSLRQEFSNSSNYIIASQQVINTIRFFLKHNQFEDKFIGYYYPMKGEVQILELWDQTSPAAFPRLDSLKTTMTFAKIDSITDLTTTRFGFKQPTSAAQSCIPEVILVPGICFSLDKYRLGFGFGHFDKYLAQVKESGYTPTIIGICFNFQLVNRLMVEAHDQMVDHILTETQII